MISPWKLGAGKMVRGERVRERERERKREREIERCLTWGRERTELKARGKKDSKPCSNWKASASHSLHVVGVCTYPMRYLGTCSQAFPYVVLQSWATFFMEWLPEAHLTLHRYMYLRYQRVL